MSNELSTHARNPLDLIAVAIERGVDPDQLGKLMDLQERWQEHEAEKAFAAAMNACQREMPVVLRSKAADRYKYAPLEEVKRAVVPVALKHGFSMSFGTTDSHLADHYRVVMELRHTGGHLRTYHLDLPADTAGKKQPVQAVGSTFSYGERYLTCKVFNVAIAVEDNDGGAPLAFLSEDQRQQVDSLLERSRVSVPKFLAWLGVSSRENIPASRFPDIIRELEKKLPKESRE